MHRLLQFLMAQKPMMTPAISAWACFFWLASVSLSVVSSGSELQAEDKADETGFVSIFDGKTLEGWDGNPEFWSVQDGAITGITTAEKPTKGNTFIIWRGGETADFELRLDYKIQGGNSGIQYRSFEVKDQSWVIGGYQADFEAGNTYSGINYGERFRGILALRGQKTVIGENHKPVVKEQFAEGAALQSAIKKDDWNSYRIVARGFQFDHYINDTLMSSVIDEDLKDRRAKGLLALQLHAGPPMKVQFKNIRLKTLDAAAEKVSSSKEPAKKKVLLLAGNRSHGFGAHDHTAGCTLLARLLNESGLPIEATMHSLQSQGWPSPEVLSAADSIVIYADGGGGHPFNNHLDELQKLVDRGTGIVCIHYGVETVAGKPGQAFLDWTGGYFEPHWSVNPHWTADYKAFPAHPITSGVKPFRINDEWYYHMRFREGMEGVTPILTDLPGPETLKRPDGPHSGNPAVREAIAKGEPQHMAWAHQRANGARGFGCSGGHVHWNWGHPEFRRLFLNGIAWTAQVDVPTGGVPIGQVGVEELLVGHDEPIPENFNKARVEAMLKEWN